MNYRQYWVDGMMCWDFNKFTPEDVAANQPEIIHVVEAAYVEELKLEVIAANKLAEIFKGSIGHSEVSLIMKNRQQEDIINMLEEFVDSISVRELDSMNIVKRMAVKNTIARMRGEA